MLISHFCSPSLSLSRFCGWPKLDVDFYPPSTLNAEAGAMNRINSTVVSVHYHSDAERAKEEH